MGISGPPRDPASADRGGGYIRDAIGRSAPVVMQASKSPAIRHLIQLISVALAEVLVVELAFCDGKMVGLMH
jgi:hypothetical protein